MNKLNTNSSNKSNKKTKTILKKTKLNKWINE